MDTTRALLALIALSAAALVACAAPPAADTTAQIPATFMSFNIRTSSADDGDNAWPLRRALAAQVATSQGPDVLGLQEAQPDQVAFLAEQLPAYRFLGRSREADAGAGEAVPLFYHAGRWALDETEHGTFWLSDTPDMPGSRSWGNFFPRIVTWARLVHRESGKALYVYNAHFDHESENARVQSSELLRRRIAARRHADPVVVMGDFNAAPASAVLRTLIGSDGSLVDTYAVTSDSAARASGTFHEFTGVRDGRRIDFILVSPQFEVRDARILYDEDDGHYPSDHFPVTATVGY